MTLMEQVDRFTSRRKLELLAILFVGLSVAIVALLSLASWLLFVGFCLLLSALGFLWASVSSLGDDEKMTLDEALDLAAPARDEERKLAVLRGLKDLEYEHGLGKISDDDYRTISQRYRLEAKRLLERLDSSEASLRQLVSDAIAIRLEKPELPEAERKNAALESSGKDAP